MPKLHVEKYSRASQEAAAMVASGEILSPSIDARLGASSNGLKFCDSLVLYAPLVSMSMLGYSHQACKTNRFHTRDFLAAPGHPVMPALLEPKDLVAWPPPGHRLTPSLTLSRAYTRKRCSAAGFTWWPLSNSRSKPYGRFICSGTCALGKLFPFCNSGWIPSRACFA